MQKSGLEIKKPFLLLFCLWGFLYLRACFPDSRFLAIRSAAAITWGHMIEMIYRRPPLEPVCGTTYTHWSGGVSAYLMNQFYYSYFLAELKLFIPGFPLLHIV